MNKQQSGFTLIELIMVIVILGALAVSVIPRYVDLQNEADQASAEGVAGSLAAAMAINYAGCVAGDPACLDTTSIPDCASTPEALADGGISIAAYTVQDEAGGVAIGARGVAADCEVVGPAPTNATVPFVAISPGP